MTSQKNPKIKHFIFITPKNKYSMHESRGKKAHIQNPKKKTYLDRFRSCTLHIQRSSFVFCRLVGRSVGFQTKSQRNAITTHINSYLRVIRPYKNGKNTHIGSELWASQSHIIILYAKRKFRIVLIAKELVRQQQQQQQSEAQ